MATIRQIAELAQVSTNTVSLALRNSSRISIATRERIQELAERLHYQPPARRGVPVAGTIGCLVSCLSMPHYSRIMSGILQECFTQGRPALVLDYYHHLRGDTHYALQSLLEKDVTGVLIINPEQVFPASAILELRSRNIAIVLVGGQGSELPVDTITNDVHHLTIAVVDYLLQLGHRHLLYLEPPAEVVAGERQRAIRTHCALRGIHIDMDTYDMTRDAVAMLQTILTRRPCPTAIVCNSDFEAMALIHAAAHIGVRIPGDISIIGCGNLFGTQIMSPALTTVDLYPEVLGRHAAQLLLTRLDQRDGSSQPTVELVPTWLLIRESCAAPAQAPATATSGGYHASTHPAVVTFLNRLRQGFTEGRVYVTQRNGTLPPHPELWGWRQMRPKAPWQPAARAIDIGFLDGPWLLLHLTPLTHYLQGMSPSIGDAEPRSMPQLTRLLAEAGLIDVVHTGQRRHYTKVVRCQHKRQRVLRLRVTSLYHEATLLM